MDNIKEKHKQIQTNLTKISIVTVCLNSKMTIEQTIRSVVLQNYNSLEYIIIDGESDDGTIDIVKKYANAYPDTIRYLSEKDKGIYDAMNKGIKLCTGDVIGILNSDDYYEDGVFETINNCIQKQEKKDHYVLYGYTRFLDCENELFIMFKNINMIDQEMICHPSCFVSKKVYDDYGLYDISFKAAADYDFFLKLNRESDTVFYPVNKITTNFRIGGMTSSYKSIAETYEIKNKYQIIGKMHCKIAKLVFFIRSIVIK